MFSNNKGGVRFKLSLFAIKNVLRNRRDELQITQEELSEGICDVSTLARYERGLITPTNERYLELQYKMGRTGERYILPYDMAVFVDARYYNEYEQMLHEGKYDEIYENLHAIEENLCYTGTKEYMQFIGRIEILKKSNDISITYELESLLRKTVNEYKDGIVPLTKIYNDTELHILNSIAIGYWNNGNKEKALHIYEQLINYFNSAESNLGSLICNKIHLNYSNYLGLSLEYEKSIEIIKTAIKIIWESETQEYLYNYIFNLGWNEYYIGVRDEKITLIEKAIAHINTAIAIASYMDEPPNKIEAMDRFLGSIYCSGSKMQDTE